jgi:hypothetical protein
MRSHAALAIALAIGVASGCVRSTAPTVTAPRSAPPISAPAPASNVLRGDYVGSTECQACHAKEYAAWLTSPMHRMTRNADATDVRAPFDGRTMRFKGDAVSLESRGGARFVRIARDGMAARDAELYRVTRVIGGRTREDFVGVRVRESDDARAVSEERVLPVSYLIFSGTLRYKGYSVLSHERGSAQSGPVWSETCLFCHNTVPFFSTILGALAGPHAPAYQGEDVDALLPDARRWTWSVADADGLRSAVDAELAHLRAPTASGDTPTLVRAAITATHDRFGGADLVEVGIGCESCHGGARTHVADPDTPPRFLPYAPFLRVATTPAKNERAARAQAINRVCARCHQVLFSRYPWTWEGGRRQSFDRGGSSMNSGEARDFLLGGCASELACTTCHDPHDGKPVPIGNGVCTSCHGAYATDDRLRAHTHHEPRGAGSACIACHMPRKNIGLDLALTAYHRIGSPTDPERVLRDRPLECALCHADKSVETLVRTMETWWNKAYARDLLVRLYGDLQAKPLAATLERGKPHEVAVAAAALGETHARDAAPLITLGLANEYPLVRMVSARALDAALGRPCAIDVNGGDVPQIEAAAGKCLSSFGLAAKPWAPSAPPVEKTEGEPTED